jgi:hypothetical protein
MPTFTQAELEVIDEYRREAKRVSKMKPPKGKAPKGGPPNPVESLLKERGFKLGRLR